MIRIVRIDAPDVLVPTPPPGRRLYARDEVRSALSDMQHGKCCYCEKHIDLNEIFPPDEESGRGSNVERHVEHFRPKGKDEYRHLMNDWNNLLLACNTCNVNKGQKFDLDHNDDPLCIDPSDPDIDPECHIMLKVMDLKMSPENDDAKVVPRNGSAKGEWTILNVKLNEGSCRKARWTKVFEIIKDIADYREAARQPEQGTLQLQVLDNKRSSHAEFAFVAREVCRQYNVPYECET